MKAFKAYDIRGRVSDELNDDIAYRIGRAYAQLFKPQKIVVGRDIRISSEGLCVSLSRGLTEGGCDVYDIGLCGTEEIYFATFSQNMDGGIMVTASHNPMDYNGMKLVREGSRPISGDSGLNDIRDLVASGEFVVSPRQGTVLPLDCKQEYIRHLLGYINVPSLMSFKVVVNAGNGCAGPVIDLLEAHLPFQFVKVHHDPDGTFPHGIPNPLLPENRDATARAVVETGADIGIAWDGDFDRCFLFDGQGRFIEGYYIVGLLAAALLLKSPGAKIIHDPRLTWNTIDMVTTAGGVPVMSKTGHAFIKERMRQEDAVYGGEMSAHHYFRDFAYCDSGMIPWLLVLQLMSHEGKALSDLLNERMTSFPVSGEINRTVVDSKKVLAALEVRYAGHATSVDFTDGLSCEYADWRFNVRLSNTEPLLRLNVEARGNNLLMERKTDEILNYIKEVDA
jgi:phosphomannomutase